MWTMNIRQDKVDNEYSGHENGDKEMEKQREMMMTKVEDINAIVMS